MGPHLAQWPGMRPTSNSATTNMGQNWGAVPLWRRGAGSPCKTMWPGPRPTRVPSFILIHPTVWSQYTNVTDRQERQVRQTDRTGQRSDSIGRTVLQTVAQKLKLQVQLLAASASCLVRELAICELAYLRVVQIAYQATLRIW